MTIIEGLDDFVDDIDNRFINGEALIETELYNGKWSDNCLKVKSPY